jgi:hypothetical protein
MHGFCHDDDSNDLQALEAEKRRTSELTKAAAEQAAGQQKQQAQLAALERQLQEEKVRGGQQHGF